MALNHDDNTENMSLLLLALPAYSMQSRVCVTVRYASVSFAHRTALLRVCCCGPGELGIDRLLPAAQQQHGAQLQMRAEPCTLSADIGS